MNIVLRTLVALSILAVSIPVASVAKADEAEAKVCKTGKILDPDTGKCVTPRGS
jgi:hypothetical protein